MNAFCHAIVTGGAGFIGSHLCDLLLQAGHRVTVVDDLSTGHLKNLQGADRSPHFRLIKKSVNDLSLSDISEPIDWIFHLAGRADLVPSIENPEDYFEVNVRGTLNMLQLARQLKAKRFVYTASSSSYGIPDTYPTPEGYPCHCEHPYALTKYLGEQLVLHWHQVYQVPAVSLRLFNVYGPRSRTSGVYGAVFGVFLKQKLAGKPFTVVGDGTQTRDFTYVTDVANAFLTTAQSDVSGEVFNVGSGNTYPINDLVKYLQGEVTYIPKRPGEPDRTHGDITKITKQIGWKPSVSLQDGVAEMLKVIDNWKDAPLWDESSIAKATEGWFKHLGNAQTTSGSPE